MTVVEAAKGKMNKRQSSELLQITKLDFLWGAIAFFETSGLNELMESPNAAGTFCCRRFSSHPGFFLPMPDAVLRSE